jgi:bla regulator protein blaR1
MSTEFMETWLFDSLLVTTLLMAAILLVRRHVARIFGPGIAYALWLIPAARLLMPSLEGAPVSAVAEAQWVRDAVRESVVAGIPSSEPVVTTAGEVALASTVDYAALGITFWLGGAVLFFIIQMIRYASMRDDLLSDAEEIAYIEGVSVVASDQVAGPLAFGLFKRYIAVPQDFTKAYSPAERELAIAHEMAHHKSGDLFANLVAFSILCLQWFNPVAWMSWNAFRFDQEAACDARVLAGKGAEERAIYGQALARTAFDGVPTFATALNSPKTIIERLRRLTMKDASNTRRSLGKLGILAAGAIILPLTATIVPAVVAQEAETVATDDAKPEIAKKNVKVIRIHGGDKNVHLISHDGEGKEVTKVERDGKTFVFHTDKKLSEDEVEKMVAEAKKSAEEAHKMAEEHRGTAMSMKVHADEMEDAHKRMTVMHKNIGDAQSFSWDGKEFHKAMNIAAYIPEIDIREITKNCKEGQPVTTDVSGFDGKGKSRVKLVMCGKGQAKIARASALEGLREAKDDVAGDEDIPESIRKDVVEKLKEQIRKLEAQADKAG